MFFHRPLEMMMQLYERTDEVNCFFCILNQRAQLRRKMNSRNNFFHAAKIMDKALTDSGLHADLERSS
jgi:hypothetical protein